MVDAGPVRAPADGGGVNAVQPRLLVPEFDGAALDVPLLQAEFIAKVGSGRVCRLGCR